MTAWNEYPFRMFFWSASIKSFSVERHNRLTLKAPKYAPFRMWIKKKSAHTKPTWRGTKDGVYKLYQWSVSGRVKYNQQQNECREEEEIEGKKTKRTSEQSGNKTEAIRYVASKPRRWLLSAGILAYHALVESQSQNVNSVVVCASSCVWWCTGRPRELGSVCCTHHAPASTPYTPYTPTWNDSTIFEARRWG